MTAHFFLDDIAPDELELRGEDARHAARALRLRAGEEVTISDGRGGLARTVVDGVPSATSVRVRVRSRRQVPRATPAVHVFPAIPKGGKLDLVVQKLTELGVARVAPWFAARSQVRWDDAKRRAHARRWSEIARAAAKQSRRCWLPEVEPPGALGTLPAVTVVFDEAAETPFSAAIQALRAAEEVGVVVGPEGGFEDAERDAFVHAGARSVWLGPLIIRAETAAIVGPTLVLHAVHLLG